MLRQHELSWMLKLCMIMIPESDLICVDNLKYCWYVSLIIYVETSSYQYLRIFSIFRAFLCHPVADGVLQ